MSTVITIFTFSAPFIAIFFAVLAALKTVKRTASPKKAMTRHFITTAGVFTLCMTLSFAALAAESDGGVAVSEAVTQAGLSQAGMGFIAAALAVGLGGLGGGIAIASGAPAAIGATSEDPKAFGKALIFVALGEAVALYGFVIAFVILSKLPSFATLV